MFLNDFDGVIIRPLIDSVEIVEEAADHVDVVVGAGVTWDDFVAWCVDRNLYGAENLSGIPATWGLRLCRILARMVRRLRTS